MKKFAMGVLSFAVMGCSAMTVATAEGLSLGEKKKMAYWKQELAGEGHNVSPKAFKKHCGYALKVELDDKIADPFMASGKNAAMFCSAAMDEMANMCDSDKLYKEAIAKSVKVLSCQYSAEAKSASDFSMANGGVFVLAMNPELSNIREKTRKFLEENL